MKINVRGTRVRKPCAMDVYKHFKSNIFIVNKPLYGNLRDIFKMKTRYQSSSIISRVLGANSGG